MGGGLQRLLTESNNIAKNVKDEITEAPRRMCLHITHFIGSPFTERQMRLVLLVGCGRSSPSSRLCGGRTTSNAPSERKRTTKHEVTRLHEVRSDKRDGVYQEWLHTCWGPRTRVRSVLQLCRLRLLRISTSLSQSSFTQTVSKTLRKRATLSQFRVRQTH